MLRKTTLFITVLALLVLSMIFTASVGAGPPSSDKPGNPSGNGIHPILVPGNPKCKPLYANGFKPHDEPPPPGTTTYTYPDGVNTVKITMSGDQKTFDWQSTLGVDAVIVKGGDNADIFVYDLPGNPPTESFGDTMLHGPAKADGKLRTISHIEFCYDVEVANPTLATTPNPESGIVGDTLKDTAELSGGLNPTGSITFKLYPPADATCQGDPVFSEAVPVNGNDTYGTAGGYEANQVGTWRWTAYYSGDVNNKPASSGCDKELVTIGPAGPTIATTPDPESGPVGQVMLKDTAVLSDGYNPTGEITFKLYPPADATCQGDPVFSEAVPVNGNGNYGTANGYPADQVGTWRWTAHYSGDANNDPANSGCQEEQVTIGPAGPMIETTPNPVIGKVGDMLKDTAVLSAGYNPTGSITFKLYPPADDTCTGTPAFSEAVTVNGNGNYGTAGGYVAGEVGTWRWTADYSGDTNNDPASSGCQDEQVTIDPGTAVELASFEVEANDGRVMIIWQTGTEIDNAGFNIYRAASPEGPWRKINSMLIAAEGDAVSGASYTFADTPGRGIFYYQLEDVDYFGVTTLHDLVKAEMGTAVRAPWFRPTMPQF